LTPADLTVAIPTYMREDVLVATIRAVLAQGASAELLVIDQTSQHTTTVTHELEALAAQGAIRWLRLPRPSITRAMNTALTEATRPVVLFLDDDIVPGPGLLEAHARAYDEPGLSAVAGQVLQPGQEPVESPPEFTEKGLQAFLDFPFNSTARLSICACIACNFSVRRETALALGGFDENYRGAAYRFETDFCRRLCAAGGKIRFEPTASVRHLQVNTGGTRAFGSHLTSASPRHSVGDYYFALRHGRPAEALRYALHRPMRAIRTRFHLRHPWRIPATLTGELLGSLWAVQLAASGPELLRPKLTAAEEEG
jgi:GT2 family glycosyltransferase